MPPAINPMDPFGDFDLTEEERYELHIASWLHDCGKVTVPEYVVDKATKLHTLYDRIETVRMRFEIVRRDAEIRFLRRAHTEGVDPQSFQPRLKPN